MTIRTAARTTSHSVGLVLLILLFTGVMGSAQPAGEPGCSCKQVSEQPPDRQRLKDGKLAGSPELWKFRLTTTPLGGR